MEADNLPFRYIFNRRINAVINIIKEKIIEQTIKILVGSEIPNLLRNESKKSIFFISFGLDIIFRNGTKEANDKTSENALINIINKSKKS